MLHVHGSPTFWRHVIATIILLLLAFEIGRGQSLTKASVLPPSVVGGSSSTETITLSAKAGSAGIMVSLSSSSMAASALHLSKCLVVHRQPPSPYRRSRFL
ncbi:MAG: hypothetical protein P4L46_22945 [Fimbriimonas sp.]|nr:hypothetical protein [Fimbriimonas sp.]